MLITEEYRKLNALKHEQSASYGSFGFNVAKITRKIAKDIGATSILDYGCGKRTLERALGFAINNYDPAIPGCEATPEPADLVVCCDVMEHVEPDCLEAVLDDLERVTKNTLFVVVDMKLAIKHLADGRNAHLIVENEDFWLPKFLQRFRLRRYEHLEESFMAVFTAKKINES
jgi:hypothetical protein